MFKWSIGSERDGSILMGTSNGYLIEANLPLAAEYDKPPAELGNPDGIEQ
jgi:hypothetical protein